jgi:predicted nucleotidyltransferase
MQTQSDIESKIRQAKPFLKEKYRLRKIGYFGSYACGDFREDSDVDVLVDFDGSVGWGFFDVQEYLENLLGKKVDLVTPNSIRKSWRDEILHQVKYL